MVKIIATIAKIYSFCLLFFFIIEIVCQKVHVFADMSNFSKISFNGVFTKTAHGKDFYYLNFLGKKKAIACFSKNINFTCLTGLETAKINERYIPIYKIKVLSFLKGLLFYKLLSYS